MIQKGCACITSLRIGCNLRFHSIGFEFWTRSEGCRKQTSLTNFVCHLLSDLYFSAYPHLQMVVIMYFWLSSKRSSFDHLVHKSSHCLGIPYTLKHKLTW